MPAVPSTVEGRLKPEATQSFSSIESSSALASILDRRRGCWHRSCASPPSARHNERVSGSCSSVTPTVTDDSGWGAGFRQLALEGVEVINLAANGRSSKSYIDEGRWRDALGRRGNYYLIQFGHNDEPGKGPERETDPETTFRANIVRYVEEARGIGATPVLVTSLVRRIYNADGTIKTTQTPYVTVVRAIAREKNVPLVDLHAISTTDAEQAGDDVWADSQSARREGRCRSHPPECQGG